MATMTATFQAKRTETTKDKSEISRFGSDGVSRDCTATCLTKVFG